MSLTSSQLTTLKSLPCFEEVVDISLLVDGMSHTCIKVTTILQVFFVKRLNSETAKEEIFSSLYAAKHGLSPRVIYHDNAWLVTEFIDGITLDKTKLSNTKCIDTGLSLMAQLHQLMPQQNTKTIPYLDTAKSVQRLFTDPSSISAQQRLFLADITKTLTLNINTEQKRSGASNVLCHGDINYSNIIIDKSKKPWLIDFECSHLAPVEFDLSMFIAINNISPHHIDEIVNRYMVLDPSYRPNKTLLTYYVLYSYFINGLWYLDNTNDSKVSNQLRSLAIEQWFAFDSFAIKQLLDIPKLTSLFS
jgi:Predicted choline kinase involved in LPS biosynthesis